MDLVALKNEKNLFVIRQTDTNQSEELKLNRALDPALAVFSLSLSKSSHSNTSAGENSSASVAFLVLP